MRLFFVALSLLASVELVFAQTLKTSLQDSNPKYLQSGNGFAGIGIDIMKAIEDAAPGIKFTYPPSFVPFSRIIASLEQGDIDVFIGLVKNEDRFERLNFVETPLYFTYNKMVVRKNDPLQDVSGFEQIRKLGKDGVVLVDFETAHHKYLLSTGVLVDAGGKDRESNLAKLLSGRGRFYYSTDLGLAATIRESEFSDKARLLPHVFQEQAQYLVFSKKVPQATVDKVAGALKKLSANGNLHKIKIKYAP